MLTSKVTHMDTTIYEQFCSLISPVLQSIYRCFTSYFKINQLDELKCLLQTFSSTQHMIKSAGSQLLSGFWHLLCKIKGSLSQLYCELGATQHGATPTFKAHLPIRSVTMCQDFFFLTYSPVFITPHFLSAVNWGMSVTPQGKAQIISNANVTQSKA